ncbi:IclR family transcriptional regulator [Sporolactobacillus pectinivorans]|uniref:IclR family transcriptional regulator n=1 Tax=Sporolactobacillus pectinivorans TaxID=1591408 RepID=UPI00138FD05C|nr:IclR family transcriptional regulator [Sporolactobacillus pectinivorans]
MEWMDRFVKLMDTISDCPPSGIGITELSKETLLSKGTLHRMLQCMLDHKIVLQSHETKKYMLGPKSMKWGSTFLQMQDPVGLLAQYCNRLGEETGLYAFICRFQGDEIFCTYTHQPSEMRNSFFVHVGQRMPLHCAAAAEIILAYQAADIIKTMIEKEKLTAYTPFTVTDETEIARRLRLARGARIASCMQELELGQSALSAPIFHQPDQTVISISVVGDHHDIEARTEDLIKALKKISAEASEHLMSMNTLSSLI